MGDFLSVFPSKLNLEPTEPLVCPQKPNLKPTEPPKTKTNLEPIQVRSNTNRYSIFMFHKISTSIQIEKGHDYIKIYDGGSQYSEVVANLSGIYNQTKISVPGNQVFISFEANSNSDNNNKGFMTYILEKGNHFLVRKEF